MIGALETHAKSRGLLVGALALAAILARLRAPSPPPRSIEGVASALGSAAGASVRPDDFLWEERRGFFEDAFVGRRVLFLASSAAGGPRDLYRARVRLTRAGRPIEVSDVKNLTHTPLGDDRDLTGSGHTVAFATATKDGVQGVTLLDLEGDGSRAPAFGARLWEALDRFATTGSTRGLGRTEIAFAEPPTEAKLEVGASALVLSLGSEALPAAFDFASNSLQTGHQGAFGATAQRVPEAPRPAGTVLADVLGMTLGAAPAELARSLFARAPHLPSRAETAAAPEGLRIAADYPAEAGWPPAPLVPVHPRPFDGEGFWHVAPSMQGPAQQVAAPPLLEALVRPDASDADALVRLVAIDTRRFDLRVVPGVLSPEPQGGPHGSGRLPGGAEGARVVAAFAMARAPAVTQLGFFGEGRLFAPLVPGAPALAVRPDGRAALGAWPADAARDAFVAVAQGASVSATGDFALAASGGRVARSALCRSKTGYLLYAFAASANPASLEAGLKLAGCVSALHLGAAPAPVGFAYVRAAAAENGTTTFTGTLASSAMSMPVSNLGDAQLEEMGVLLSRDALPLSVSPKKLTWAPDGGAQPSPAWLPGVLSFDTENLGAKVKVLAFLPDRATFRLATGSDEGTSSRGDKPGPTPAERGSALAAFGLSVSKRSGRRGLVVRGAEVVKPSRGGTWLVFEGSRARIARPGEALPAGVDATELPLVADEHKLLPAAREVGTQRPRSALCTLPDGTLVIAHASFDTDEATTEALLDVGCERIVALDRGAHDGVLVHRAGGEHAPEASYEATVLYALPTPFAGTATAFE